MGWLARRVGFWAYTSMAIYTNTGGSGWSFLMVLPLLWVHFVMSNIVHCVVSGVVGSWYFSPGLDNVVGPSLKRAGTTSLGTVVWVGLVEWAGGLNGVQFAGMASLLPRLFRTHPGTIDASLGSCDRHGVRLSTDV
jgi:hypothetical protein